MANEDVLENKYYNYDEESVKRIVDKYNELKKSIKDKEEKEEEFKGTRPSKEGAISVLSREIPEYDVIVGKVKKLEKELKKELSKKTAEDLLLKIKNHEKIEAEKLKNMVADDIFIKKQ